MQQLRLFFAMALLYMFRVTIPPIIRSTMLDDGMMHGTTNIKSRSTLDAHPASYSVGTGVLPLGGGMNQLGHEVNHSAAFSAEVKNEWRCSSSPCMHSWYGQAEL